jgi:exosome complex component RRP4
MSKKIVVPGELVSMERKRLGQNVFMHEGKIYSECVGLIDTDSNSASVVCLKGSYVPREGDLVIGVVESEKFSGYLIDVNSIYHSFVSKRELNELLKPGTVVSAKVSEINEMKEISLNSARVFFGGMVIEVSPVKVPRLIGRDASMLNVLKEGTGCNLVIGKNGRLWVKGGNIELLLKAIQKIEDEAHLSNLTNKITAFLAENKSKGEINE